MYVDNGQLTDLQEAGRTGQHLVHAFFEACGSSLSDKERSWMGPTGDFLEIVHDFGHIQEDGKVDFEPRPELARIKTF